MRKLLYIPCSPDGFPVSCFSPLSCSGPTPSHNYCFDYHSSYSISPGYCNFKHFYLFSFISFKRSAYFMAHEFPPSQRSDSGRFTLVACHIAASEPMNRNMSIPITILFLLLFIDVPSCISTSYLIYTVRGSMILSRIPAILAITTP